MKRKNYIIALLLGLVLVACKDPYGDEVFVVPEDLPAAPFMRATETMDVDYKLNLWADFVEHAGLFTQLSLGRTYTVFAPSNQAVSNFLQDNGYGSVKDVDPAEARAIVRYHVIPDVARGRLTFTEGVFSDTTASGDRLNIGFLEGDATNTMVNDEARIEHFDIAVTNGLIQVLDKVLTPITSTVWDMINNSRYSIFAQALEATTISDTLSLLTATRLDQDGFPTYYKYYFTAFAVTDEVYAADGISSFDALVSRLGAGDDYTASDNALNQYVRYHVLTGVQSYADLANFGVNELGEDVLSKNIPSYYDQGIIGLSSYNATLYINRDDTPVGEDIKNPGFTLLRYNINCRNGMVHEPGSWMPITEPKITVYKHDFSNYPELGQIFPNNWHVLNGTGNFNQPIPNDIACYTFYTPVGANANPLRYQNTTANGLNFSQLIKDNALFYDLLGVRLGSMGWVEMQLPAIVAGKYKISLNHYSPKAASPSGLITFFIDNVQVGRTTTRGVSTSTEAFRKIVINEGFVLSETKTRTLKIMAGDGDESVIDHLLFEPIYE